MDLIHILSVASALLLVVTDALRFTLPPNHKKCLKEEIHKDVLVTGEYELSDSPGQKAVLLVICILYYGLWCMHMFVWVRYELQTARDVLNDSQVCH